MKLLHNKADFLLFPLNALLCVVIVSCQPFSKAEKQKNPETMTSAQDNGLETYILDYDVNDLDIDITYESNDRDAGFECYYQFYNEELAGQDGLDADDSKFSICNFGSITISRIEDRNLLFKVRAIKPGGIKDLTPARLTIDRNKKTNDGSNPGSNGDPDLDLNLFSIEILNKISVLESGSSYTFSFAMKKQGQEFDPANQFQFYCKTAETDEYLLCPDGKSFTFNNVTEGRRYNLYIEAVHIETGRPILSHDFVSFVKKSNVVVPPPEPPPIDTMPVPTQPTDIRSFNMAYNTISVPEGFYLTRKTGTVLTNLHDYIQLREGQSTPYSGQYPSSRQQCSSFADAILYYRFPSMGALYYCEGDLTSQGNPFVQLFNDSLPGSMIELYQSSLNGRLRYQEFLSENTFFEKHFSEGQCTDDTIDLTETLINIMYGRRVPTMSSDTDIRPVFAGDKACASGSNNGRIHIILSRGNVETVYSLDATLDRRTREFDYTLSIQNAVTILRNAIPSL